MKKIFVISMMTLAFAGFGYQSVEADTSGNGTANINVTAPSTDSFYLETYPSFDFGTAKNNVKQLTAGGDKPYTVVDLRGGSSGYQIQVKVDDFIAADGSNKTLPVTDFMISIGDSTNTSIQGSSLINVYNQNGTVLSAGVNTNGLSVSGGTSAKLDLKNATGLATGVQYNATITHSLVDGIGN
ncbi:MAG: hypothetical protein LBT37_00375 [Lactobacillaceae bacterium]|nr:hypothetical protein [Lactobacillaceae bacterium]